MRIIISPAKQMRIDTDLFTCTELPVFMEKTVRACPMKNRRNSGYAATRSPAKIVSDSRIWTFGRT